MGRKGRVEKVFVANAHPSLEVDSERLRSVASLVMHKENCCRGGVNIILATDEDLRKMNDQYLGRDHPTDVMAFPMGGDEHPRAEDTVAGEIYVSLDRARQQAREYSVTFVQEVERLVIHGLLHLCGYDHEGKEEAGRMRSREDKFLETIR
jgi:probable rRNA maturation factor